MANNPITECKKVEEQGKNIIEEAKQEADSMIAEAHRRGREALNGVEEKAQLEIESIWAESKKKVSEIKEQGKEDLQTRIESLDKIDDKKIQEAVDLVIKKIV